IVQADIAVFGQKDFQQLAVIKKMVKDLCMPINIIGAETARAEDGLALSSRNQYLSTSNRKIASQLSSVIRQAQENINNRESLQATTIKELEQQACHKLEQQGFIVDYFNIVDASTLTSVTEHTSEIVILAAALLGSTRLIDNLCFFR
ncbi:MAG: pantoate--beta-alanine ligase, partial [Sinobacterium sp.]|nr:pantoate--beta-alanine ligase [Sinobacterium sp.]